MVVTPSLCTQMLVLLVLVSTVNGFSNGIQTTVSARPVHRLPLATDRTSSSSTWTTAAFPCRPFSHGASSTQLAVIPFLGTAASAASASTVLKTVGKTAIAVALRGGGGVDDLELAVDSFEWCANLGAPAALVGGAVLATLAETREDLSPRKSDPQNLRLLKQVTRFLLLSAFALEIISIFSTTVTGTMLLAHGDVPAGVQAGIQYHSPMGFLRFNHEFEYLTARITFLQGLFNWLIATALEVVIPKEAEGEAAKRMNQFIASSLLTIVLLM